MKTAEEWAKDLGVSFFDDIQPQRIVIDADLGFETWIKQIQLDAYKAGMTEAAEIIGHNLPIRHLDNLYVKAILTARDNKTSL